MQSHKRRQRGRQQAARQERCAAVAERLRPLLRRPVPNLCGWAGGAPRVDWASLPPSVDPAESSRLSAERGQRKRWQVESVLAVLEPLLDGYRAGGGASPVRIADFGSGSGNLLALAALLPACEFTLVDLNAHATALARQRAEAAGLRNVRAVCARIDDYGGELDVAISMHACGWASDEAQARYLP